MRTPTKPFGRPAIRVADEIVSKMSSQNNNSRSSSKEFISPVNHFTPHIATATSSLLLPL